MCYITTTVCTVLYNTKCGLVLQQHDLLHIIYFACAFLMNFKISLELEHTCTVRIELYIELNANEVE